MNCETCEGVGMIPTGGYTYDGTPLYEACPDCNQKKNWEKVDK